MSTLPTGTVTLLFTDVEGSTRLWLQYPVPMAAALARHDTLVRSAIETAGGYVFKTVGDAFCAAFTNATDALEAAASAQLALHTEAWPPDAKLAARMALHTGECEERDGDYFGTAVNRTARLEEIANGGQVVVSGLTASLARSHLSAGLELIPRGSHRLNDFDLPEEVFQLRVAGLPDDFRPLRSLPMDTPTNLTESVSSFVGRDAELAEVVELLGVRRLVTLTGAGGVGKTRLAVEAGRAVLSSTPDGVWLAELATVRDPDLVAKEVLHELGIGEQSGTEAVDTLVAVLSTQNRMIILDNCEQVVDAVASLADTICRMCPGITLLSTSQSPLHISGEVIYRVPPLSLPPDQVVERAALNGSGAVALFVERAAAAQVPGFEVTDENAALVGSICRRLDGLPLALELATARLRSMPLATLNDRLEHAIPLLTRGSTVGLERHRTLRATIDWSYNLLSAPEQALFRRTTVFVDGFDLEAAEGVCGLDDISRDDVADLLASLIDKSLLVAEARGGTLRYRLQQTLREYGIERVAEQADREGNAEAAQIVAAHADYYLTLADQAAPHLHTRAVRKWLWQINADELNLLLAIENSLGSEEGASRVLRQFWSLQRYWRDARQPIRALNALDRALERVGPDLPASRRGEALYCKAKFLSWVDRRLELEALLAAVDLAREAGDQSLEAYALSRCSRCLADNGREDEALRLGADSVALARRLGEPGLLGFALYQYAGALDEAGDPTAEAVCLEALELAGESGDDLNAWLLHNNFALLMLQKGDLVAARRHLDLALDITGKEQSTRSSQVYCNMAYLLLLEGDSEHAATYFSDVLRLSWLSGTVWHTPYMVLGLACCATREGDLIRSATLHGGADAWLSESSNQWESFERMVRSEDLTILRERLGDDFDPLYNEGRAMPREEIIKVALISR